MITAQNDTTAANLQLVTVRQELDVADVGDQSDMSCPTFSGRQLENAPQHCKNAKLWMACKKLPAHTAAVARTGAADADRNMAEIS